MKKILTIILSLVLCLQFMACVHAPNNNVDQDGDSTKPSVLTFEEEIAQKQDKIRLIGEGQKDNMAFSYEVRPETNFKAIAYQEWIDILVNKATDRIAECKDKVELNNVYSEERDKIQKALGFVKNKVNFYKSRYRAVYSGRYGEIAYDIIQFDQTLLASGGNFSMNFVCEDEQVEFLCVKYRRAVLENGDVTERALVGEPKAYKSGEYFNWSDHKTNNLDFAGVIVKKGDTVLGYTFMSGLGEMYESITFDAEKLNTVTEEQVLCYFNSALSSNADKSVMNATALQNVVSYDPWSFVVWNKVEALNFNAENQPFVISFDGVYENGYDYPLEAGFEVCASKPFTYNSQEFTFTTINTGDSLAPSIEDGHLTITAKADGQSRAFYFLYVKTIGDGYRVLGVEDLFVSLDLEGTSDLDIYNSVTPEFEQAILNAFVKIYG